MSRRVALCAALAAAYFALAAWGLSSAPVAGIETPLCAPTGMSLAVLFIFGTDVWPGVALGSLLASLWIGRPPAVAAATAAGHVVEAVAGVLLLRRAGFRRELDRLRDVAALLFLAGALTALISTTVGVLSRWMAGWTRLATSGHAWHGTWLSNFVSVTVVAPFLLTWSAGGAFSRSWPRLLEAGGLAAVVLGTAALLFGWNTQASLYLGAYLLFPSMIWAALRFGPRGSSAAVLAAAATAVAGTSLGQGPFARATLLQSVLSLQIFLGVASTTAMTLAAALGERDRARRRAGRLNVELEALNYSVAHDLRGPLRSIDAASEALERHPERLKALVARIHETVVRMAALIDSLLRLSGLEYAELSFRPVDLTAVARQTADILAAASPERRVRFTIADGMTADGDPDLLGVLLWNLMENAWKFSQGRETAEIEVGLAHRAGEDVFFVRDNGAGFDPAHADRLFKPFRRLHGRGEFPGSGIGLAMAQRVVQRHGGRIWARSTPGGGATFCFTISPLREEHEEQPYLVGGRRSG